MRSRIKVGAGIALVASLLAGGGHPRRAFAITGVIQNPANGHWCKRYDTTSLISWQAAKSNAESVGGYLGTVTSAAEDQGIINTFSWEAFHAR